MIDFLKLPSPCYVLDEELLDRNLATDRPCAPGIGRRNYRGPEGLRHVEHLSRAGAAFRRCDCKFRRRGASRFRGVRASRPHLRPGLHGLAISTRYLNCSDHITFNSLSPSSAASDQKALISGISCGLRINPAVFARRDGPLQPLRPRLAAGRHGRTAGGARRTSGGCRGAAFPRPLRIAPGASAKGAGGRRDAFRSVPRPDQMAQHGRRPPDDGLVVRLRPT